VGPLGGTRHDTYANTGCTDVAKRGRSWLRDPRGRRSSKGVDCNIPRLNRINNILIPLSCNFFSGSPSVKNSRVKRAEPWSNLMMGDRPRSIPEYAEKTRVGL
jgi:hypothetical protein